MRSFITSMLHHVIRIIKSRSIRLVEHAAHMGKMTNLYKIIIRKPEGKTTWKTKA
jgi:hypothetical protein